MNSNSILSSSLLDIIFENRNKDYGAYILRKNYNKRLFKSLAIVLFLVSVFIFQQMFVEKNVRKQLSFIQPGFPDPIITTLQTKKEIETKKNIHPQTKSSKKSNDIPVIVKDDSVAKALHADTLSPSSNIKTTDEFAPGENPGVQRFGNSDTENKVPVTPAVPLVNKAIPVDFPEVPPQFQGGLNELIKFLQRNLISPQDMEEDDEITVKIRFVVNYDGDVTGFNVVKSGGEIFNNEVIRVLKKMPRWIPGKTSGENVSAYFIIPVTFKESK